MRNLLSVLLLLIPLVLPTNFVNAFAYIFAFNFNVPNLITHPVGYTGTGGVLNITVGIDPTSANAMAMVTSTQNVIASWNNLAPTTGNLDFSGIVAGGEVDFESVLLHEMGHAMGLAHCNAASESGLGGANENYTRAEEGANTAFDIDPGGDGIIGSADDLRGDDVNFNWFRMSNNNPFTIPGTVDGTTYSLDLVDLPAGDNFSANADRDVGTALGSANTEAVMQQGSFFGEAQRTLAHDDVAGLRFAMAGVDETAGNADDYTFNLTYAGLTTAADIVIDFDNNQTGFAVASSGGSSINATHWRVTGSSIFFNTGYNWLFNTPLPVRLLNFDVVDENGDAYLKWMTAEEVDHDYFEVQRSLDAENWEKIGKVEPKAGASNTGLREYEFKDEKFVRYGNKVHYRLAFVGIDGTYTYSRVKIVSYIWENHSQIALARVPFQKNTTLEVLLDRDTEVSFSIYNLEGKEISRGSFSGVEGSNSYPLGSTQQLVPGVYVIKVGIGTSTRIIKFLTE